MRLRIILFTLCSFALVVTALFQLAGPQRNTSRFAHSISGVGVVLDRQWVELRLSRGERAAKAGETYRPLVDRDRAMFGFEFATRHGDEHWYRQTPSVSYFLRVPLWAIDAALALAIVASFISVRRAARRTQRLLRRECPTCGYDLRATPDRCPECGAKATRAR